MWSSGKSIWQDLTNFCVFHFKNCTQHHISTHVIITSSSTHTYYHDLSIFVLCYSLSYKNLWHTNRVRIFFRFWTSSKKKVCFHNSKSQKGSDIVRASRLYQILLDYLFSNCSFALPDQHAIKMNIKYLIRYKVESELIN